MAVVELVPLLILILFLVLAISVLTSAFHGGRHRLPPSPLALPIIGHFHLVGPLIHQSFHKLSLRLGPIFSLRLGSVPCIVVSSPDLAKNFLKTHELSFISHVQSIAIERLTYNASLAFAPYGPYWRVIKKICTTEFLSSRSVSSFSSLRAREYRRLLRLLAEKAERCEAVNLTKELPKLSNNVIAKMMLGSSHSSDEQRDEEARLVTRQVTRIFGEFNLSDFVWFCKKLDLQGFGKRIEHTHRRFDALVEKVIVQREQLRNKNNKDINGGCCTLQRDAREEKVKDFLDILLDLLEDETAEVKLTRVHIKALIMDLFTAGTDSTAISLEWALAELINHPKVLKKAREEIHAVVGNRRLVLESDGPNLPYIQAIIKETFRLHPPVPLVSRNSVQECKIGKYVIPANTMLFVNVWAIGRDPKYWESPLEFRPERFLQLGGPNQKSVTDVRGQHFELMPFGTGRRICPGLNLAMQMIPGLLAAMIQCFDWKVIGSNPKNMKNDHDVLEMDELPGMISPRAHDLVCVPVARFSPLDILDT